MEDSTEAKFILSVNDMRLATEDLEDDLETTFKDWNLDTSDADEILDDFAETYSCDSGRCEVPIHLEFSVDDLNVLTKEENAVSVCKAFLDFFNVNAKVSGEWSTCQFSITNETIYLDTTYTEGMAEC